jgi:repressor LexA
MTLTPRLQDTYRFVSGYILRHGQAPLHREIAAALGIQSKGVINRYLRALEDEQLIELAPGHRGIRLTGQTLPGTLPLVGRIAAGRPIEAIPDQDEINLMDFFMGPNRFVLRVTGDSMIDAGILNGDMVIVEQRTHAGNNEIVVALIDNEEATLKSIKYNMDGTLTLTPANPRLKPVTYPAERVAIQGVVVGQMRSYR